MHYRISALVDSDRDESDMAMYTEGVLYKEFGSLGLVDLSVYEVNPTGAPM